MAARRVRRTRCSHSTDRADGRSDVVASTASESSPSSLELRHFHRLRRTGPETRRHRGRCEGRLAAPGVAVAPRSERQRQRSGTHATHQPGAGGDPPSRIQRGLDARTAGAQARQSARAAPSRDSATTTTSSSRFGQDQGCVDAAGRCHRVARHSPQGEVDTRASRLGLHGGAARSIQPGVWWLRGPWPRGAGWCLRALRRLGRRAPGGLVWAVWQLGRVQRMPWQRPRATGLRAMRWRRSAGRTQLPHQRAHTPWRTGWGSAARAGPPPGGPALTG